MSTTTPKLQKYRRMGSMEQLFVFLNELKLNWGSCVSISKIDGLSTIPTPKLQSLCNQLYKKYQSLQSIYLTVDTIYKFDWVYTGVLPFKIIRYNTNNHDETFLHKIYETEINWRFLLLNDFNLTQTHIQNNNYNIQTIPPLYRIIIYNNHFILNIHHGIGDGLCLIELSKDLSRLLNSDLAFENKFIPYVKLEDSIKPEYASSWLMNQMVNYFVPTWFAMWFSKVYSNTKFLSKYNPLGMHNDDILRFKHMYSHHDNNYNELFSFPLTLPYNKFDWHIDYIPFKFNKQITKSIVKQCKLHNVHISSLILYITNACMIETHSHILNKQYYETVIGNMFSALPLFKNNKDIKQSFGMNAVPYNNIIPYCKNAKIGSDKFWQLVTNISETLWDKDDNKVIKVYKQKFPFLNTKKWIRYNWEYLIGDVPMGPPTVSNMQTIDVNKNNYKYKTTEWYATANPAVGFGAPYINCVNSIKGIGEITFNFIYGTQFLTKDVALKVVSKLKEKLGIIASLKTNYQSKL